MGLKLNILATAAVLMPVAAAAQEAQPATPPQSTAPGQTGTTPGQQQTTPGEASEMTPAVTGETPSGQTTAQGQATADARATVKATKADVKAGAAVFDSSGNSVGKIESVTAKGVVLNTGKVQVTVPLSAFAKNDKGLLIGMTKDEIEAAAKKSS